MTGMTRDDKTMHDCDERGREGMTRDDYRSLGITRDDWDDCV